ncbi:peptidyl-tRNA hydrolase ICT1, mitochondrial [Homalodisca vitripennis]|uniref:peptidyl-tRNA hydrolase ICT1, mitochondrial n=1 Tax=Homalodisca vitripennis TaxID=197043 RepID=UPI001EEB6E6C|nr:peptidyl-tRNA hydrolase ICT1, mitochondrial [Homalodisca vitripennis]
MSFYIGLKRLSAILISQNNFRSCLYSNINTLRSESNYQSSISLKSLYPSSSLHLTTPKQVPERPDGKFNGYIPVESLTITYSRSSGPGGQNVNTVNTKVDVRFQVDKAEWLSPNTRAKIADVHKTKISKDGFLIVRSDKTRSQQLNLADCMEILRVMIREAEYNPPEPSPETQEQIRRRKEKANQQRLIEKRSRSQLKASRQAPTF